MKRSSLLYILNISCAPQNWNWAFTWKKLRYQVIHELNERHAGTFSLDSICRLSGTTRQAYYKHFSYQHQSRSDDELVLEWVKEIRTHQPHLGVHKLYQLLKEHLQQHHIKIKMGRDALYDLLASENLLVKKDAKPPLSLIPNIGSGSIKSDSRYADRSSKAGLGERHYLYLVDIPHKEVLLQFWWKISYQFSYSSLQNGTLDCLPVHQWQ